MKELFSLMKENKTVRNNVIAHFLELLASLLCLAMAIYLSILPALVMFFIFMFYDIARRLFQKTERQMAAMNTMAYLCLVAAENAGKELSQEERKALLVFRQFDYIQKVHENLIIDKYKELNNKY